MHLSDLSSEVTQIAFIQLHAMSPVDQVLKVSSNGHDPFSKMTTMPVFGKTI